MQIVFLNKVASELDKFGGISSSRFIEILNKQEFSAKKDFLNEFVLKVNEKIEKRIDEVKFRVDDNKAKAGELGMYLYASTISDLELIVSILGILNINVISISDKLASEILQCSIELFNHFHESETEVGDIAIELINRARSIALGSVIKERLNKNALIFEEYLNDLEKRNKRRLVNSDYKSIVDSVEEFQTIDDSIPNALKFARTCNKHLKRIKSKLGSKDDFYISMSTIVVSNAQGMIVSKINESIDKLERRSKYVIYQNSLKYNFGYIHPSDEVPYAPEFPFQKLNMDLKTGWKTTVFLGSFDMSEDQRKYYQTNKNSLKKLYIQMNNHIYFIFDKPMLKTDLLFIGLFILIFVIAIVKLALS